jgi:hypothetical protein
MKINNYIRYIIGTYIGFALHTAIIGSLSIYNFALLFVLFFVIIKDISDGNKI